MAGLLEFSTTYKPFMYPWAMNIAEEHEKIHWGTWEAKLQEDVNQWKGGHINTLEKEQTHRADQMLSPEHSNIRTGPNRLRTSLLWSCGLVLTPDSTDLRYLEACGAAERRMSQY